MLPGKIQGLIVREMYRLSGPNIIIFIPLLVLGIIVAALTPHYFIQSRIISLTSLLIGEIGLSFIPVIALFPRATFIQAIVLAVIYLLTTLVTCLAAWGINSLGWPGEYSFLIKERSILSVNWMPSLKMPLPPMMYISFPNSSAFSIPSFSSPEFQEFF